MFFKCTAFPRSVEPTSNITYKNETGQDFMNIWLHVPSNV